jgi:hypothetical protein
LNIVLFKVWRVILKDSVPQNVGYGTPKVAKLFKGSENSYSLYDMFAQPTHYFRNEWTT